MAFSERIKLLIDVATGGSTSSIKKLQTELANTDGAFNKLKVVGGGAFDYLKQNAATAALAAGTAILGFATKAVGDFQRVALGAGQLRDSLGVTADEASRLREVAGDLGINVESVERTIGRMNRAASETPEAFDAIGAAIVRNSDGTINVTETFLATIDALNDIPDASKRATAAQEIFGRSWMDIAEMIDLGAEGVRDAMGSVEEAKLIDDAEVERARKFRDTLDTLKGVVENLTLAFGENLLPALTESAEAVASLSGALQDLKVPEMLGADLERHLTGPLDNIEAGFDALDRKLTTDVVGSVNFTNETLVKLAAGLGLTEEQVRNLAAATGGAEEQHRRHFAALENEAAGLQESERAARLARGEAEVLAEITEQAASAAERHAEALLEEAEAALEVSGGFRSLGEANLTLRESQARANETFKDAEASMEDVVRAAQNVADAEVDVFDATMQANGATLSHTSRLDANNASLLRQASQLQGPQRRAILDYIAEINGIPPERISEIEALLDQGSVIQAESVLQETSRARESTVTADANTSAAESQLNWVARNRTATVTVRTIGGGSSTTFGNFGGHQVREHGGPVEAGQAYVVGEKRPELFVPDQDGTILPRVPDLATPTALGMGGAVGAAGGGAVFNITVNAGIGTNGPDVGRRIVEAIKQYERSNGTVWRR